MANSQHYADAPTVKLEDYIPVKMFRTVHLQDVCENLGVLNRKFLC